MDITNIDKKAANSRIQWHAFSGPDSERYHQELHESILLALMNRQVLSLTIRHYP
jgi:hypothetical protein